MTITDKELQALLNGGGVYQADILECLVGEEQEYSTCAFCDNAFTGRTCFMRGEPWVKPGDDPAQAKMVALKVTCSETCSQNLVEEWLNEHLPDVTDIYFAYRA